MHPVLFKFLVPEFLQGFLPAEITIFTYGALIALGAILAAFYAAIQYKKALDIPFHETNNLILIVIIAAVVGGKFFFFFENPSYYFGTPSNMLKSGGSGFVFYGSLIFVITSLFIYFKIKKLPAMQMLDIIAISGTIVHFFGRLGCFNAGCCHGTPYDGIFSVIFTDPVCMAKPLGTPLHPTQLYSAFSILTIFVVLIILKNRKKFHGQIFLTYVILYAIARGIIEMFRGDYARGYIIENLLTHSQLISIILLIVTGYFYSKLRKNKINDKTKK